MRAIELKNVSFSYNGFTDKVLSDVDFYVDYGEVALLSGLSGEGKSTLLSIASGIIPNIVKGEITGEVFVDGKTIIGQKLAAVCRKVGVVLQNADSQIIHKTVDDEIAFGCENFALAADKIGAQIDRVFYCFAERNLKSSHSIGFSLDITECNISACYYTGIIEVGGSGNKNFHGIGFAMDICNSEIYDCFVNADIFYERVERLNGFVRDIENSEIKNFYVAGQCAGKLIDGVKNSTIINGHVINTACDSTLSERRKGFLISEEEAQQLERVITLPILRGQSVHHVCNTHKDELTVCEKTIYNYIDGGVFELKNIDLPRKVRYRIRKKPKEYRIDIHCREGRTYEDYMSFMRKNDVPIVQMDTVKGGIAGSVLLTIHFVSCGFMIAFLRPANTSKSVIDVFDTLDKLLGRETFRTLFPAILTDNGSEFSNPMRLEFDKGGERRTHIFYAKETVLTRKAVLK